MHMMPMDIRLPEQDWLTRQSRGVVAACLGEPPGPISEPLRECGSLRAITSPLEGYRDETAWSESIVHWADELSLIHI